jgi:Outer membrane protein beta-barrel domain
MKRTFLSMAIVACLASIAIAQDLHFGIQASPSFSWMSTSSSKISGSGAATGLKLGLIVENRFSQAYSFSTGIGFHFNTGGRLLFDSPSKYWADSYGEFDVKPTVRADSALFPRDVKFRYSTTYVEIPFGLKLRTPENGTHTRYFAEPGLTLGFKSGSKGSIIGSNSLDQERINITKEVSFFNISWGIGGGAEYIISNNTAIVGGIYFQRGFTDVTTDNGTLYDADGKTNPRKENSKGTISSLTIRVGVMF